MPVLQPPLAYFLTWTTYGTRLHGDPRGTVDLSHNRVGTPVLPWDQLRVIQAASLLAQPPYVMGDAERATVDRAIRDHCAIRAWRIHELNVRTNHVHIVITANSHTPELVEKQFKQWGTRRLIDAGLIGRGRHVWTDHGSTIWLNFPEELDGAIHYVRNCQ